LVGGEVAGGVVGQVPVGVVGVEQRLGQQRPYVDVGGGVVHEGAFAAAAD
jgi:hypothetical protein